MPTLRITLAGLLIVAVLIGIAVFPPGGAELSWLRAQDRGPDPAGLFRPGDHVSILGNALAERMQHDGFLETFLHLRLPEHDLTIRNLGFTGDELTFRLRSAGFGSPDEWLARNRTDVVLAFFGYNESFAGAQGMDKFRRDLEGFIEHTLSQRYNGKSPPRLVLFSPIAHEDLNDPNLPDGQANNLRLEMYTKVMAETARARGVLFVDLFAPTKDAYRRDDRPWTVNGVHLNEHGNAGVARIIDQALFPGAAAVDLTAPAVVQLRDAVRDKNFHWFHRYRTTDGYSIYGGRADLRFVNGQTNREVAQREMEVLDVMTANRDRIVWTLARHAAARPQHRLQPPPLPDDSNTPPFLTVITNKPGPGPNGRHLFLDGEEAISRMTLAKGLHVNLFACEKRFPELVNPVQMSFDTRGRLWVAVWPSYPHWKPKEEMNDKLLILEDTDGDGKADVCKTFAGGLHNPTGFEFWNGGVLVAQAPDLWFLQDRDGDDRADIRVRVLGGLDSADTHHTANSFVFDPGGGLYFQEGTFHRTQVETPYGPPIRCADAGVFRYEPRTHKFEVYISFAFANPHGHVFDRWGQDIVVDGTGSQPYHGALFSGHLDFPHKHSKPPQIYQPWTRPCPGIEILSSQHFPPSMQGNLLVANVIGYQGILQYRIRDEGASFVGTEEERLLSSTDPNFRPSDIKIGPDGAIYFLDWHNPIIGHMQHNLRDPSRDREHGRIYRITYVGRPLSQPPRIAGEPIEKLLDLLKHPEDRVRYRVRIELSSRPTEQVLAACQKWLAGLDRDDPEHEHHVLEALWLHQSHNVCNPELLQRVLASPEYRARAAAARVLCHWRDRVPDSLELFKKLASDPHPRVRLEAVRAASFYQVPEAIEVALIARDQPSDPYLEYVHGETRRALEPFLKRAIAEGKPIAFTTAAGKRHFLKNLSTEDLRKLPPSPEVYRELVQRPGLRDEVRGAAVQNLARLEGKSPVRLLLELLQREPGGAAATDNATSGLQAGLAFDYLRLLTSQPQQELAAVRDELVRLAQSRSDGVLRQVGLVALAAADGNADAAWKLALGSAEALRDFALAVPLLRDPAQRQALYPRLEALLRGLPPEIPQAQTAQAAESMVRRAAMTALTSVRGQEVSAFKALARCVRDDVERQAAIQALQRIPATHWPKDEVPPLLDALLRHVRDIPLEQRTSPAALEALQLADALATLLPPEQARQVRSQLGDLGVRILRISTIPDQMLFDKERLAVQAGKPFEILFENNDLMPHNFVLVRPGALQEIGQLAEATAAEPGALSRHFVPQSDKVLLASRLLQPREEQRLRFTAPSQPGVYPYVCTYPGHWRRMYGALYVVENLPEYLQDEEGYLARHPLPEADELLRFVRPRKEWKLEELAGAVAQLGEHRSYTNGKQLFTIANCASCHKLGGVGVEIGQDLTKLDPQYTPLDVLKHILEPSAKVEDKYASYVFETDDGRTLTGLILEETAEEVKIIENPLLKTQPVLLKKSEIAGRKKSPTSLMPKGLLDKLTREEILDLLAYIVAKGDPDSPLYRAGHGPSHGGHGRRHH
jgi:putative heme-binding domain-containing protein